MPGGHVRKTKNKHTRCHTEQTAHNDDDVSPLIRWLNLESTLKKKI